MESRHGLTTTRLAFPAGTVERTLIFIPALILALSTSGCEGKVPQTPVANEGQKVATTPVSVVRMNDQSAGAQLLSGFYGVENNAWRWTAGKFSVLLLTPPAARQSGATLTFAFSIPDGVIEKLKRITLTASVNGTAFGPTVYTKPGQQTYTAGIPASLLSADTVKIDFALDKTVAPSGADIRPLGIIASSVGLSPKQQ
jgi:hypothetical protein